MDKEKIRVSKLDAARRQLKTAIELWFQEADPVSTHTLAAAAHEIIYDLNKKRGTQAKHFLGAQYLDPKDLEIVVPLFKRAAGYFKHAERNPDSFLDFEPKHNIGMIFSAIAGLQTLGETLNATEIAFYWWFVLYDPTALPEEFEKISKRLPADRVAYFRGLSRKEYFKNVLNVLSIFGGTK